MASDQPGGNVSVQPPRAWREQHTNGPSETKGHGHRDTACAHATEQAPGGSGLHSRLQEPNQVPRSDFGHSHRACARSSTACFLGQVTRLN